jgi:UDP-N-acetylglucosamine--N-acetylmuramyl-(pentapeptide) pyrophosphoryl-undecaprenol N-acetylglucosamine transferase
MAGALARETKRVRIRGIAIAGGGTGGHVFPALAVAEEISRLWNGPLFWIGSRKGIERKLVEAAGIGFRGIPAGKLRRYVSLKNLTDLARTAAGIISSTVILLREKPALVFSKGGFVSVPTVIAASLCGIPCFTHESDFDPGLATRINMRFCEKVFLAFADTVAFLPPAHRAKAVVVGNPVRSAILRGDPAEGKRLVGCPSRSRLLLVMGGSQGSAAINALVGSILPDLCRLCFVVHQMGEKEYRKARVTGYFPAPFFHAEIAHIMAAADLVIGRSGANTLAELAALGKPSLLIPLPQGGMSRGDQIRNAEQFRSHGAAHVLRQEEATSPALLHLVKELLEDPSRLEEMGKKARSLGGSGSALLIARHILARIGVES